MQKGKQCHKSCGHQRSNPKTLQSNTLHTTNACHYHHHPQVKLSTAFNHHNLLVNCSVVVDTWNNPDWEEFFYNRDQSTRNGRTRCRLVHKLWTGKWQTLPESRRQRHTFIPLCNTNPTQLDSRQAQLDERSQACHLQQFAHGPVASTMDVGREQWTPHRLHVKGTQHHEWTGRQQAVQDQYFLLA